MKRIGLWPFFSQQDKINGGFRFDTCGATKQAQFIEEMLRFANIEVCAAVPDSAPFDLFSEQKRCSIPPNNGLQTIHWDTDNIWRIFHECDIAITWHEFLAIPIRKVFPKLPIIQLLAVKPDSELFDLAWKAATKVVCQTYTQAHYVKQSTGIVPDVWQMCYDERRIKQNTLKPVDVLFVSRCSSTNYTRHLEFSALVWGGLEVYYTDVTGYLRKDRPELNYTEPEVYYEALSGTKVAVALNDDMFGGQAIREAIASGATPVVLRCDAFVEMLGPRWPFYVKADLSNLEYVVRAATLCERPEIPPQALCQSYQAQWPKVWSTLCTILQ